jgi:hypothetical protein
MEALLKMKNKLYHMHIRQTNDLQEYFAINFILILNQVNFAIIQLNSEGNHSKILQHFDFSKLYYFFGYSVKHFL